MRIHIPADLIRSNFSDALSDMYKQEVPLYAELLDIVQGVNQSVLAADPSLGETVSGGGRLGSYDCEPHGAIRIGTASELNALRRVFRVMGMFPVGYYDLSVAGVPVHSTAFRPIDRASFDVSPLRIFCSLLRLELIEDADLRVRAAELLETRQILSDRAMELVAIAETEDGLTREEADEFVAEVLETFRWRDTARVTAETYDRLLKEHRLIADVVSFKGPHINHLTPRTLDIDAVQAEMLRRGIKAKSVVEGPPLRKVNILLRQTSFQALSEDIRFIAEDGSEGEKGAHLARFGEIEQRGVALTPKGRELYDSLLAEVRGFTGSVGEGYEQRLKTVFARFPDDAEVLRKEGLAYFEYQITPKGELAIEAGVAVKPDLDECIEEGLVAARAIVYEDFLPVSAAGIFQSNLGGVERGAYEGNASQRAFETALGTSVLDAFALYSQQEAASRDGVLKQLARVPA